MREVKTDKNIPPEQLLQWKLK